MVQYGGPQAILTAKDVASSNLTLNALLGGKKKSWMNASGMAVGPTPRPEGWQRCVVKSVDEKMARSEGLGLSVPLSYKAAMQPRMGVVDSHGFNSINRSMASVLPSPTPSNEPSPIQTLESPVINTNSLGTYVSGTTLSDPSLQTQPTMAANDSSAPLSADARQLRWVTATVPIQAAEPLPVVQLPPPRPVPPMRVASPSSHSPQEFNNMLAMLEEHVNSTGGNDALSNALERPRVELLRSACKEQDGFYMALHQLFCCASLDVRMLETLPFIGNIDTVMAAFRIMSQLIRGNETMAPAHLQFFADFPFPFTSLNAKNGAYVQVIGQVGRFLNHLPDAWGHLTQLCGQRGYPPQVKELVTQMWLKSSTLLGIFFTAMRRNLGIKDGDLGIKIDNMFNSDRDIYRRMSMRGAPLTPAEEAEMARQDTARIEEYRRIVHQARSIAQPSGGITNTASPAFQQANSAPMNRPNNGRQSPLVTQGPSSVFQQANSAPMSRPNNGRQSPLVAQGPYPATQSSQAMNRLQQSVPQRAPQSMNHIATQMPNSTQLVNTAQQADGHIVSAVLQPPVSTFSASPVSPASGTFTFSQTAPYPLNQHTQAPSRQPNTMQPNNVSYPSTFLNHQPGYGPQTFQGQNPQPPMMQQYGAQVTGFPPPTNQGIHPPGWQGQNQPPPQQQAPQYPQNTPGYANPRPVFQSQNGHRLHDYQHTLESRYQQQASPQVQQQHTRQVFINQRPINGGTRPQSTAPPTVGQQPQAQFRPTPQPRASAGAPQASRQGSHRPVYLANQHSIPVQTLNSRASFPTSPALPKAHIPENIMSQLLIPPDGMIIPNHHPQPDYTALHQAHLRSPKFVPLAASARPERHYQAIFTFAKGPQVLSRKAPSTKLSFKVPENIYSKLARDKEDKTSALKLREVRSGTLQYRIRAIQVRKGQKDIKANEWIIANCVWPQSIFIEVNKCVIDTRRKVLHGADLPIDITSLVVSQADGKSNEVHISALKPGTAVENHFYGFAVEITEILTHSQILAWMQLPAQQITADTTLANIKKSLGGSLTNDDDIVMSAADLTIDLADPFTARIFEIPVRGISCPHRECFDLVTFLETRPSKTKGPNQPTIVDCWKCPLCNGDARPRSLRVDQFLVGVRVQLGMEDKLDTKAILVKEDGSWMPKPEVMTGTGKRKKSDNDNEGEKYGDVDVDSDEDGRDRKRSKSFSGVREKTVEVIELD